jgi:hypothetical protein
MMENQLKRDLSADKRAMDRGVAMTVAPLIIAAMLLFPVTALTENPDHVKNCNNFAEITRAIANERDAGVPAAKVRSELEGSKLGPERKQIIESLITTLYASPGITPEQAAVQALQGCLGHP